MSRCTRKPTICICENKDADQLRSNYCEADQRLCFRYMASTIPLLSKSKISSLYPSSVLLQADLCKTRSETQIVAFSHAQAHIFSKERKVNLPSRLSISRLCHFSFPCFSVLEFTLITTRTRTSLSKHRTHQSMLLLTLKQRF